MEEKLDRIIHQPIRTQIMAYLISRGSSDYTEIKKQLGLSDGHMTTHMRELLEHHYVEAKKRFIDNKPCTTYYITQKGQDAFAQYIIALKNIISL